MLASKLDVKAVVSLLLLFVLICSCKNDRINKLKENEGKYTVKIAVSAGDHINTLQSDTSKFMVYPFNVGVFEDKRMKKKEVIVVGTKIRGGQEISIKPIAKLTYRKKDGKIVEMLVARPTQASLITAKVENYFDLISVHYGIQKMIETWILYANGYGTTYDIKWENEEAAIEYINS